MRDVVLPFQLGGGAVRGRLVRLGPAAGEIVGAGNHPAAVGSLLAETLALAAALAGSLKYDGVFTLQAQGDGPVRLLVADVTSEGAIRGTARYDAEGLPEGGRSVPDLLGSGHLAFTVDQGPDTDRYQGIVALEGETLAECAELYFRQSEQIETSVRLAVGREDGWVASALTIQRMPANQTGAPILTHEDSEDRWNTARVLMASVTEAELLGLEPAVVAHRLFHAEGLQLFEPRSLAAKCRCSEERVARTLRSFPRDEIAALKDERGDVVVGCEFCHRSYVFDEGALARIYAG